MTCGSDGCGGSCGTCSGGEFCQGSVCVAGTSVTGFVYDSATNAKLANAHCTLTNNSPTSYSATTDANGQYKISNVKPDIYVLKCTNSLYLSTSIQVLVEVSSSEQRLPSLYLVANPCLTSPPCSGSGSCGSAGTCICNEGIGGYDCSGSLLGPHCVPYRGTFSESFTNSVLIRSAINKALAKLGNLHSQLTMIQSSLPEYLSNSCCYDSNNHTSSATNPNYYEFVHYPLDLDSMASITHTFLGELNVYNEDNTNFLTDLRDMMFGGK